MIARPGRAVSVIVPCHNGSTSIGRCLEAIFAQSLPAHEILVVDDCSQDNTTTVVEECFRRRDDLGAATTVRLIRREQNGGAAAARAAGATLARGEIIAFVDADCAPPSDWLATIAALFEAHPEWGGLGGRYVHPEMKTAQGRLGALEEQYAHWVFAQHPDTALPPGGNSAFRKRVWAEGRTWRESYHFKGMGSGEDSVAAHEIKRRAGVRFVSELFVYHHFREDGYFRRHFNRGFSRTSIIANNLTSSAESQLVLEAYGGWRLLLSSFCLGLALVALAAVPAAPQRVGIAVAGLLLAHWLLAAKFYRTVRELQKGAAAPITVSAVASGVYRGLLLVRTLCWVIGCATATVRQLRFRVSRAWNVICSIVHFWRPGRISKLFYFVTSKCNARCAFCFNLDNVVNWQARKPSELTLDEVTRIARNFKRLPYLTLSGGEPFIRGDLPDVVHAFYAQAKTQWVTIPTNGALTERTIAATLEILNRCPGVFLTIQVSLDSLHEDHDKSRMIKGGFDKMAQTLKALAGIRTDYRNLRIQIATCYDAFNRHRIQEIVAYCREHFDYDQQMFYLIRDTHKLVTDGNNHLVPSYLDVLEENEAREWREHSRTLWSRAVRTLQALVYRDIVRIKIDHEFLRPCSATQKFATLWDDGQFSPCEILEKTSLGNIKDYEYDFYKLKADRAVDDLHRKEIVGKKCNCDWMCATPINMLYDPSVYLDIFLGLFNPSEIAHGKVVAPVPTKGT